MSKGNGATKQELYDRDMGRCWLCHGLIDLTFKHPHPLSLTVDHIISKAAGGKTTFRNLAIAHMACNEHKKDMLPWEFFNLPEGIMYRKEGASALVLLLNDDELFYVCRKLQHTRNKKLKKIMQNILNEMSDYDEQIKNNVGQIART